MSRRRHHHHHHLLLSLLLLSLFFFFSLERLDLPLYHLVVFTYISNHFLHWPYVLYPIPLFVCNKSFVSLFVSLWVVVGVGDLSVEKRYYQWKELREKKEKRYKRKERIVVSRRMSKLEMKKWDWEI